MSIIRYGEIYGKHLNSLLICIYEGLSEDSQINPIISYYLKLSPVTTTGFDYFLRKTLGDYKKKSILGTKILFKYENEVEYLIINEVSIKVKILQQNRSII